MKAKKKKGIPPTSTKSVLTGQVKPGLIQVVGISKRGWKVIGIGIGIVVLGFIILTRTNPDGSNWASIVSPFLLIAGYITIAIGIMV